VTADATGHGEKGTRTRERAIAALLGAKNVEGAARECGISKSTLLRWMQDRAFRDAFREARRRVFEAAISQLQSGAVDAVATLRRNLTCRKPAIEVGAARAMLELMLRSVELFDLEERIGKLEDAISLRQGGRR
jgi:transposase-like protein